MPQNRKYGIASATRAYVDLKSQQDKDKADKAKEATKQAAAEALKAKEHDDKWKAAITAEEMLGTGADSILTDYYETLKSKGIMAAPDKTIIGSFREKAAQEADENKQLLDLERENMLETLFSLDVSAPTTQKRAFDEYESFLPAGYSGEAKPTVVASDILPKVQDWRNKRAVSAGQRQSKTIAARNTGLGEAGFRNKTEPTWSEKDLQSKYYTEMGKVDSEIKKIEASNAENKKMRDANIAADPKMDKNKRAALESMYPIQPIPKKQDYSTWKKGFHAKFNAESEIIDFEAEAAAMSVEQLLEMTRQ